MSRRKRQPGLFDQTNYQEQIRGLGIVTNRIATAVNFEGFRSKLERLAPVHSGDKGGRPAYDRVMMFKILLLQSLYQLSDEQTEVQIMDRMSFRMFLGLDLQDNVPDRNTIWNFREQLNSVNGFEELLEEVNRQLKAVGLEASNGMIVDATIVEVPVQRNTRGQNEVIKRDETPSEWTDKQRSHKDTDARWTKKHGRSFFGYKQHLRVDAKTKLIERCRVTPANTHDSQVLLPLLDSDTCLRNLYADSAYASEDTKDLLEVGAIGNRVQHRASAHKPLTKRQHQQNHTRAKVRSRIEHVFGFMKRSGHAYQARCVGLIRVTGKAIMNAITYNLHRSSFIVPQLKRT